MMTMMVPTYLVVDLEKECDESLMPTTSKGSSQMTATSTMAMPGVTPVKMPMATPVKLSMAMPVEMPMKTPITMPMSRTMAMLTKGIQAKVMPKKAMLKKARTTIALSPMVMPRTMTSSIFQRKKFGFDNCCSAVNCFNCEERLNTWRRELCEIHSEKKHSDCPCLAPYEMLKFPEDEDMRNQWTAALKKSPFVPNENSLICSIHFVDGGPTLLNPIPTLKLGFEKTLLETQEQHSGQALDVSAPSVLPTAGSLSEHEYSEIKPKRRTRNRRKLRINKQTVDLSLTAQLKPEPFCTDLKTMKKMRADAKNRLWKSKR